MSRGEGQGNTHNIAKSITVYGTLKAEGVTFTDPGEDSAPEIWEAIMFKDGSQGYFKDCTVQNGGGGAYSYAMIHLETGAQVSFSSCTFEYADGGIFGNTDFSGSLSVDPCSFHDLGGAIDIEGSADTQGASIDIENSEFKDVNGNALGRVAGNTVVKISNTGQIKIAGNTFSNNHTEHLNIDLSLAGGGLGPRQVELSNNQFLENDEAEHYPVVIFGGTSISGSGNTVSHYAAGYDGIEVLSGGDQNGNHDIKWSLTGTKFIVADGIKISPSTEGSSVSLTISPGVEIYFHYLKNLTIDGQLTANGTEEAPIVFTGESADRPGKGISLTGNSSNSSVSYLQARYTQALAIYGEKEGDPLDITISNCDIGDAALDGIYMEGKTTSGVRIDTCTFHDISNKSMTVAAIHLRNGAAPIIEGSTFQKNKVGLWLESFVGSLMSYPQVTDQLLKRIPHMPFS